MYNEILNNKKGLEYIKAPYSYDKKMKLLQTIEITPKKQKAGFVRRLLKLIGLWH